MKRTTKNADLPRMGRKHIEAIMTPRSRDHKLRESCKVVERFARSIGRDCQVIFSDDGVEVAPLSWAGSATGEDLFNALVEARATESNTEEGGPDGR